MNVARVELGTIAKIVAGQSPPGETYNTKGNGHPFFQGKAEFGERYPTPVKWCTEPMKLAEAGDILISVRAPVGPTNLATETCCIGRGLAAIRPDPNKADRGFVHWAIIAARPTLELKSNGSTFAAINRNDLAKLPIPLPPLDEQRRIVGLLDRAAEIRRRADDARAKARTIIPALFLDTFGDPATNPKGWPIKKLGDLGELDRGRSRHRPRNAPELYGGPYPFVQTGDVANAKGRIRRHEQSYSAAGLAQSKMWPAGTLCITIAANIGKTGILEFDACFPDSVVGFRPSEEVTSEFIQTSLDFMQAKIEANAPQAAQKNINLQVLRGLDMICPPLEIQAAFAEHGKRIESLARHLDAAAAKAEAMAAALSAEIFGEPRPRLETAIPQALPPTRQPVSA